MSIAAYKICTGSFADDLADSVAGALDEGYVPAGGIVVMPETAGADGYLAQAMHMPEKAPILNAPVRYKTTEQGEVRRREGILRAILPASGTLGDRLLIEDENTNLMVIPVESVSIH